MDSDIILDNISILKDLTKSYSKEYVTETDDVIRETIFKAIDLNQQTIEQLKNYYVLLKFRDIDNM